MCGKKSWPLPVYQGTNVLKIGKNSYRLEDFEKPQAAQNPNLGPPEERLALYILNTIDLGNSWDHSKDAAGRVLLFMRGKRIKE